MPNLPDLVARIRIDDTDLDRVEGKSRGLFSGLRGAIPVAAISAGAAVAVKELNQVGTELESMQAKAQTVFGSAIGDVERWAKSNANAMGLTRREATGVAAGFADLLVPMGFTQKQAAQMSTDVVGLSGALSSWTNGQKSAEEVAQILSAAMLGEREALKSLGISISDADVKARLAEKGQDELTGAILEQAKAVATQELIFEKSKDAQKAFSDGTKTNAERALEAKAKFNELRDTLAVRLAPAFATMTDIAIKVVDIFENMNGGVKAAIGVLAGLVVAVVAINKAIQAWTAVQAALNVVLSLNPIGLVVLAIAGLVTALIIAYKKSETFRDIVDGAFQAVGKAAGFLKDVAIGAFQLMLNMWFTVVGGLLEGAAKAFGWVPGIGPKLREASDKFSEFRDDVNAKLNQIRDKEVKVTADTSQADAALKAFLRRLDEYAAAGGNILDFSVKPRGAQNRAHGGPVTGGHPYIVGERGPELFVPRVSGTVLAKVPNVGDVTVNVNVAGNADTAFAPAVGREVQSVMQELLFSVRSGRRA